MNNLYSFEGKSDVGIQKTINEDYIDSLQIDDETLLLIIADGSGSEANGFQPAIIAGTEIKATVKRFYDNNPSLFFTYSDLILHEAFMCTNRILSVFSACDSARFSKFACSVTCCLLHKHSATIVSIGNCRLYMIRLFKNNPSIHLLTTDHTQAADMVMAGLLNEEDYYNHVDRLVLTRALGISPKPQIQILKDISVKKNDIILMTTDGIHYAIRPEAMRDIVLQSGSCIDAAGSLIEAAKMEKYADNMSVIVAYLP